MSLSRSLALAPLRRYIADPDKLAGQVGRLSHDLGKLTRSLGKDAKHSAGEMADDLSHYASELVEQLTPVAKRIGKGARKAGRQLQQDPAPALIALGTFALVCSLVLARR